MIFLLKNPLCILFFFLNVIPLFLLGLCVYIYRQRVDTVSLAFPTNLSLVLRWWFKKLLLYIAKLENPKFQ